MSLETTQDVLLMVLKERRAQERRYGDVNKTTKAGTGPDTRWLMPYTADSAVTIQRKLREDYELFEEETKSVTWVHLIREELAEAFELDPSEPELITELVQVAALCVSFIEHLQSGEAQ